MGTAFFDLDLTLLDVNSGHLWVRSEWRAGRLTTGQTLKAAWWMARYALGDADLVHAFEAAASTLTGQEEAVIARRTREWFAAEVRDHLRPGAAEALEHHRRAGDRLVLATSGTAYVADLALEAYGLEEAICTRFEVVEGRFTGRISELAFGSLKARRALQWAEDRGVDLEEATFYTDSATDLPLLEVVGEPVAVHPDRKLAAEAARRGWRVERW